MKRSRIIASVIAALTVAASVFALAFAILTPQAHAATGGTEVFHGHIFAPRNKINPSVTSSLLSYHGGPISTGPVVYINYWGSQWNTGFSSGGYTSAQAQTYVNGFFGGIGGSSWGAIDTQYCQGVAVGATSCPAGSAFIGNQTGLLKGTWVDTTSLPKRIGQSDIANAATRLMQHFGYNANAIYFVMTPSGHSMSGFGTQWCAWHTSTSTSSGPIAYAYQPYSPDAGSNCGQNYVNSTNNSFGNGYFDGFSITGGHEWAEAETDMQPSGSTIAWQGSGGGSDENGDKCAWNQNGGVSANITLGSNFYAVQPIWSNGTTSGRGSHCVTTYP